MKIATYSINKRFGPFRGWLEQACPDVVCLQEPKCEQHSFPADELQRLGDRSVAKGQRSWICIAILARNAEPVLTRDALPGGGEDRQARYIEAAVRGVLIGSAYMPHGNPQPRR